MVNKLSLYHSVRRSCSPEADFNVLRIKVYVYYFNELLHLRPTYTEINYVLFGSNVIANLHVTFIKFANCKPA